MLPMSNRLTKSKDFKRVFEKGRYLKGHSLALKFEKNGLDKSRFGFVVGLKVSKKSATRNRTKRQLRAIIQDMLKKIKNGYDVIIVARPEILEKSYQEIKEELKNNLEESKLKS